MIHIVKNYYDNTIDVYTDDYKYNEQILIPYEIAEDVWDQLMEYIEEFPPIIKNNIIYI